MDTLVIQCAISVLLLFVICESVTVLGVTAFEYNGSTMVCTPFRLSYIKEELHNYRTKTVDLFPVFVVSAADLLESDQESEMLEERKVSCCPCASEETLTTHCSIWDFPLQRTLTSEQYGQTVPNE